MIGSLPSATPDTSPGVGFHGKATVVRSGSGAWVRKIIYASALVLTFLSKDASPPLFRSGNHGLLAGLSHFHSNVLTRRFSGFVLRRSAMTSRKGSHSMVSLTLIGPILMTSSLAVLVFLLLTRTRFGGRITVMRSSKTASGVSVALGCAGTVFWIGWLQLPGRHQWHLRPLAMTKKTVPAVAGLLRNFFFSNSGQALTLTLDLYETRCKHNDFPDRAARKHR